MMEDEGDGELKESIALGRSLVDRSRMLIQ